MKMKPTILMLAAALSISTAGITAEKMQQPGYSPSTAPLQQDLLTRSATTMDDDPCWIFWNGEWYYIC